LIDPITPCPDPEFGYDGGVPILDACGFYRGLPLGFNKSITAAYPLFPDYCFFPEPQFSYLSVAGMIFTITVPQEDSDGKVDEVLEIEGLYCSDEIEPGVFGDYEVTIDDHDTQYLGKGNDVYGRDTFVPISKFDPRAACLAEHWFNRETKDADVAGN
jgi:hypothetical protein